MKHHVKNKGMVSVILTILFYWMLSAGLITWNRDTSDNVPIAVISVNGKEIFRKTLDEKKVFSLKNILDSNVVFETKIGAIRIRKNNCAHQICKRTGWISRKGQVIICIPKRILIRIEQKNEPKSIEVIAG